MSKSKLFLLTTDDEYELPVGVYDSVREMAALLGMDTYSLQSMVSRAIKTDNKHSIRVNGKHLHIYRIEVDMGGEEELPFWKKTWRPSCARRFTSWAATPSSGSARASPACLTALSCCRAAAWPSLS